jgi:FMN phosphatase YigB (HAD superfamily)
MTDKSKIILTDIDGVVLNWEYAFGEYMEFQGHQPVEGHNKYYSVRQKYNLPTDASGDLVIKTFNESAAIGFLPPLRDAQYFIKKLHEQHQYQFIAITSLSLLPYAQQLREKNLKKLFGDNCFIEVNCLDTGADKDEILDVYAREYPGAYWIEDKPQNADVGIALGLKSILIEHGHNMNYNGQAKVVVNWEEIYNILVQRG